MKKERAGVSACYRQGPFECCVIALTVAACLFNFLFRAALVLHINYVFWEPLSAPPPYSVTDSSDASWPSLAQSRGVGD